MAEILRRRIYTEGEIIYPFQGATPFNPSEITERLTRTYYKSHNGMADHPLINAPISFQGIRGLFRAVAELDEPSLDEDKKLRVVTPFGGVSFTKKILNGRMYVAETPVSLDLQFHPRTWEDLLLLDDYYFEIIAPEKSFALFCSGCEPIDFWEQKFQQKKKVKVYDYAAQDLSYLLSPKYDYHGRIPECRVPMSVSILSIMPTRIMRFPDDSTGDQIVNLEPPVLVNS